LFAVKLLSTLVSDDHVEPHWAAINPDDEKAVQKAYKDLNTVIQFGKLLTKTQPLQLRTYKANSGAPGFGATL